MSWKFKFFILLGFLGAGPTFAQDALDELEHLNDSPVTGPATGQTSGQSGNTAPTDPNQKAQGPDAKATPADATTPSNETPVEDAVTAPNYAAPATKVNAAEDKDLTTLGKLSPFEDVAVIQPRFLPKTGRVELSPSVGMIMNQAFFSNYIFSLKAAYHFSETYALELNGFYVSQSQKQVTQDLYNIFQIQTSNLVSSTSYYGADFRWSPIYGKLGFMGRSIAYFDMYFAGGLGVMQTTATSSGSPMGFHLGTGQIFAITKSIAARWDLSYYFYNVQGGSFNDMHVTIGASFYIPGAKTR